jgi:signal transduction histidine kinase
MRPIHLTLLLLLSWFRAPTSHATNSPLALTYASVSIPGPAARYIRFCHYLPPAENWDRIPDSLFQQAQGTFPHFGPDSCHVLLRIPLQVADSGTWYLRTDFAPLNFVQASVGTSITPIFGNNLQFNHPMDLPRLTLPLQLPTGPSTLHLAVQNQCGSLMVPLRLIPASRLAKESQDIGLLEGAYMGALAILFLAACMAALTFRKITHSFFALHLGFTLAFTLVHLHWAFAWFWPQLPWFNRWTQSFFAITSGASLGLFASRWIHFRAHLPKIGMAHIGLVYFLFGFALLLPLESFVPAAFHFVYRSHVIELAGIAMILLGLYAAGRLAWRGNKRAREYLVSIFPYFLTTGWALLFLTGTLDGDYNTRSHVMMVGSLAETLLQGWFLFSELGRNRSRHLQLLREHRSLEEKQRTLRIDVAQEERRGLARDLHDDLGQRIASLKLMLHTGTHTDKLDQFRQELSEMQTTLRHLTRNLHPIELEREGLAKALQNLSARQILPTRFECRSEWIDPELPVAIHLYRMIQEMLGNSLRHANAKSLSIQLGAASGHLEISVYDDGIGFDARAGASGIGLPGLQERASLLGAILKLDTSPGNGCRWTIKLPMH